MTSRQVAFFFRGYVAAIVSTGLFGLFTVLNKLFINAHISPLTVGTWMYVAAGISLVPFAARERGLALRKHFGTIAAWLFCGAVIAPACYYLGLTKISGMEGVLLLNTEGVFTSVLAFAFFKERMNLLSIISAVLMLSGGIWLSWPVPGESFFGHSLFSILVVVGTFGWAMENNLGRILSNDVPVVTLVCVRLLAAAVSMGAITLSMKQELVIPVGSILGIACAGVVSLAIPNVLFYVSMKTIGAGRTGLVLFTSTFWGMLGSLFLLKESISVPLLTGGNLVVLGLGVLAYEAGRRRKDKRMAVGFRGYVNPVKSGAKWKDGIPIAIVDVSRSGLSFIPLAAGTLPFKLNRSFYVANSEKTTIARVRIVNESGAGNARRYGCIVEKHGE